MDVKTKRFLLCGVSALMSLAAIAEPALAQDQQLPQINVFDTRLGQGITGASTSIIIRQDIEKSSALTLPDLIGREAGVQTWSNFGGVNGAGTVVDVRGFGVTAASNTLILVNGRRMNDWDLQGFDWSSIAVNSIERIEITRGNSGAVLYGDGAMGGVINIVTKSSAGAAPSGRVEGVFGSFRHYENNVSLNTSSGPFSAAAYTNVINTDSYRVNNELQQRNGVGELRYTLPDFSAFARLSGDSQHLGLPGGRRIRPALNQNQFVTDRNGSNFPFDSGDRDGLNFTTGFTKTLATGIDLVVDGGIRRKNVNSGFFSGQGSPFTYLETELTTKSVTPRVDVRQTWFGMPVKIIAGVDYYDTDYHTDRALQQSTIGLPIHVYDLSQKTFGGYWQQTMSVLPSTDISGGIRIQRNSLTANDRFDVNAPGGSSCFFGFCFPNGVQAIPLDSAETQRAWHVGIEHRFNQAFAVFGRAARSFRVPNVDERIGSSPFGAPSNFDLKTQTSHDIEGGIRVNIGAVTLQSSVYDMHLKNELHLDPVSFANINFDPTHRRGVENQATWQVTDTFRVRGGVTYIKATYEEGLFKDKNVPLVSRWTENVGLTWNILDKRLVFDANARFLSKRYQDADENNVEMRIPSYAVVDLRLGGEMQNFFWSVSAQNLLDKNYYDYGVVFGPQLYNVYPTAGRTFLARVGVTW
jgi:iron complex outermembrane receptor protein